LSASVLDAQRDARPLFELVPPAASSAAPELLDLLDMLDMPMLPWQTRYLQQMLGETATGTWAAPETCLIVPRQNGKSYLLAARILAGLFLVGEELITYTAHRVDTALEVFNLVDRLARSHPETRRQIKRTTRTGGKETLEMQDGRRLKVLARSRATGRGFTGDCLILDEALELRDHGPINALLPTLATRDNAQLCYASSAGDSGSVVLSSVRDRGHAGTDPGLCFVEYAAPARTDPDDRSAWEAANPGTPALISFQAIQRERERMSVDGFRQERLGIWSHETASAVIPATVWAEAQVELDILPEPGQVGLAFDVATDRSWSSIVCAYRVPGGVHVRMSRHDQRDDWLIDTLRDLAEVWHVPIAYDDAGPARDVGETLRLVGVEVEPIGGRDFSAACARLLSGLSAKTISVHPFAPLDEAAASASARTVGEGWAFARRSASVPVCPITAAALAVWAADHERSTFLPEPMIW
jgi:hypothetical protein